MLLDKFYCNFLCFGYVDFIEFYIVFKNKLKINLKRLGLYCFYTYLYIIIKNKKIHLKTCKMIHPEAIKRYAKLKNVKTEEHFPSTRIEFLTNNSVLAFETDYDYTIGINMGKDVWYWWKNWDGNSEETVHFHHRYNCNNGAIQKTFHKGFEAEMKISNFLDN